MNNMPVFMNDYEFKLPVSKQIIKFRHTTVNDERFLKGSNNKLKYIQNVVLNDINVGELCEVDFHLFLRELRIKSKKTQLEVSYVCKGNDCSMQELDQPKAINIEDDMSVEYATENEIHVESVDMVLFLDKLKIKDILRIEDIEFEETNPFRLAYLRLFEKLCVSIVHIDYNGEIFDNLTAENTKNWLNTLPQGIQEDIINQYHKTLDKIVLSKEFVCPMCDTVTPFKRKVDFFH